MPTATPPSTGGANRDTCTGYPEPRVFIDDQAWWTGVPLPAGTTAHVHGGTCFPLGQAVSGKVHFDVRLMLHDNPGTLYTFSLDCFNCPDNGQVHYGTALDIRCATSTCEHWLSFDIDTTLAGADGWMTFRMKPRVRLSNGNVMLTSGDWPLCVDNIAPAGCSGVVPSLVSRGWYTGFGYENPVISNPEVFLAPLRGTVNLALNFGAPSGTTPTYSAVYLDPSFHAADLGPSGCGLTCIVLFERNGPYKRPLQIDTTRISNGVHRLGFRTEATKGAGTNAGVVVVTVTVNN